MTKVSIQADIALNMVLPCIATHNFVPLPPVPPVPPPMLAAPLSLASAAIEIPVTMFWPPGFALGQNKLTSTVYHHGMTIALDGHDCGILIIHVQFAPAPNNMLTLLHIPFSSRKVAFSASTVTMNGTPTACATMIAWPPTPMIYCAEPMSPPLASAPTSHFNSVVVGMTLGDWLFGAISVAASMILDWIFRGKTPPTPISWSTIIGKFVPVKKEDWIKWGVKQGVAALLGASRPLFGNRQGEVSVSVGNPYLKVGVKVNFANGPFKAELSSRIGPASGAVSNQGASVGLDGPTSSTKYARKYGESGPTQTTTSSHFGWGEGLHSSTTTTAPDGTVTVKPGRGPTQTLPPGTTL